jgi:hypothetical protein
MGEIYDPHYTENQHEPNGCECKKAAGDQGVYAGLEYDFQAVFPLPFKKNF